MAMKHPSKSLLLRGIIATALLSVGLARLSELFDPLTASAGENEPVKLSGPIHACHLIDAPIKVSGPIHACHLIERPVNKVG
ncbi:MAG: hypothetical protein ACREIA_15680 [Opitutaceae bacterium]